MRMVPHARRVTALIGLVLALLASLGAGRPAAAAASAWLDHEHAQLRLLAATDSVGPRQDLRLGLHFRLQPGWKIYWRSPGDAGFPPALDWQGSENLAEAEVRWPVPHRFSLFGLETFGYGEEVVLPIAARLERPGEAAGLRAAVALGPAFLVAPDAALHRRIDARRRRPGSPRPGDDSAQAAPDASP